ncbi:MAG: trypsin-like peptidase domain-containing protein, partial [Anaerolineaceae bacterium]
MEDRYDPQDPYEAPRRPQNGRRGPSFLAWLLMTLLLGGLAGGGAAYIITGRQMTQYGLTRTPAVVNLQTVASDTGAPAEGDLTVVARIAQSAGPSVVEVTTESKVTHPFWGSFVTSGAGSGVIVSPEGYIVTNNHVIADSTSILVRTWEGSQFEARVIGADAQTDLAVLKIEA